MISGNPDQNYCSFNLDSRCRGNDDRKEVRHTMNFFVMTKLSLH